MRKEKNITSSERKRLIFIAFTLFALFSLLIIQYYKMQIIEGDKWTKLGDRQHFFTINEPFLRGTFISNTSIKEGHPDSPQKFVIDVQKFHLHADPDSIPLEQREEISNRLMKIMNLSVQEQLDLRQQFERKSRNRKLAMWLDKEIRDTILEWWLPYAKLNKIPRNALFFITDYQRSYPFGKLLGPVLHTIQNNKDELTGQAIPTGGLELSLNKYLVGRQGKRRLMRSPRNSLELGEVISSPQNGADVYLTINHYLQAIAEEELEKGVKQVKAKSGWAVMMDPHSGEILALAQYPFFHPPEYQFYFNDEKMIEHTRIKPITDANEPGSVMKPLTLAIALKANEVLRERGEKELFDPNAKMPTSDSYFAGRGRKPLKDTRLHYFMNMNMALQKSSNIYMARLVEKIVARLGNEWYREALSQVFGVGKKTMVELPSEAAGVLPLPGKMHANGTLEWSAGTPYTLAIGHNVQMSTLQLARAFAVIANGGYFVQPTMIRKIEKREEDGVESVLVINDPSERIRTFPRVLSQEITEELIKAMKYVTKPGGSAPKADVRGYTEVGKTGTANKIVNGSYAEKSYCSSFVGFTPAKKAAFVLAVTVDEPEYVFLPGIGKLHHGGTCAAPIFREIARKSLNYLGVAEDDPHGYPVGDPRYDPEKADWYPETRQLKEMYEKWNNKE